MFAMTTRIGVSMVVAGAAGAAVGQEFLIDFNPCNALAETASPDSNGNSWNNFCPGQFIRLAAKDGSVVGGLNDFGDDGVPEGIGFGATTGLGAGLVNDPTYGLENPDPNILFDLAVASATIDNVFRFDDGAFDPEVLEFELSNLDPAQEYSFRIFATRDQQDPRETSFTVEGAELSEPVVVQTSGPGIGVNMMSFGNDNILAEFSGILPDENGTIRVAGQVGAVGSFVYFNAMEMAIGEFPPRGQPCADQNGDGMLNGADFNAWLANFSSGSGLADVNGDGMLNGADFNAWLSAFSLGIDGSPLCFE